MSIRTTGEAILQQRELDNEARHELEEEEFNHVKENSRVRNL